ncbi:MAG: class II aldolase/adducin family protein [Candidatus Helarchaeota archaeon]
MSRFNEYKELVLKTAQYMQEKKLVIGSSGNISCLIPGENLVAVTPSGLEYDHLSSSDMCIVDLDFNKVEGPHMPSVETRMHLAVYKNRPDVNAVIHTHQCYASVLSIIGEEIPAIYDEQVAYIGYEVALVKYGMSGSPELVENVTEKLGNNCNAYIIQNHGALCLGINMKEALKAVEVLERVAMNYYLALVSGKPITKVPEPIVNTMMGKLRTEQKKEKRRKKKVARQ